MNMMAAGLLAVSCLTVSCEKDPQQASPYDIHIQGINFTNMDAAPAGSVGTPDVHTTSGSFRMYLYPNPSMNHMSLELVVDNPQPLTLTVKLVHALYAGAPQDAIVENEMLAGTVAMSEVRELEAAAPGSGSGGIGGIVQGQRVHVDFEVDRLPRGFYRVYVTLSSGEQYWDNAWIAR